EAHPELEVFGARGDFDLTRYRLVERFTYEIAANWKLWVDNALECYHCPTIHPDSFGAAYGVSPDDFHCTVGDSLFLFRFRPPSASAGWGETEPATRGFRAIQNSFGAAIVNENDYAALAWLIPIGPERSRLLNEMFVRPGADQGLLEEQLDLWDRT